MTELLNDYIWFCNKRKSHETSSSLVISDSFLTSTQVCLLKQYILDKNLNFNEIHISDPGVKSYLENMLTRDIDSRVKDSYIPLTALPPHYDDFVEGKNAIYGILGKRFKDPTPLYVVFGELIDNIYDHSEFSSAFVMAQEYHSLGVLDLTFLDNGITIPGAFRRSGIGNSSGDDECIKQAWNGTTTRKVEGRGKGIGSSYRICTKQFLGEFLIVSGKGILDLGKSMMKYKPDDKYFHLDGTLISARCKIMEAIGDWHESFIWE